MWGDAMMRPRIKILGPLELTGAEGRVPIRRLKARQLLLVLLIQRNRLVSREVLIDALWAGDVPSGPGAALRSYASTVHHALEPVPGVRMLSDRWGYTLRVDDDAIDAVWFERLLREAHARQAGGANVAALECLDTGLALVRGEPLDEATHIQSATGEVRRLRSLLMEACERRLEVLLTLGRLDEALTAARALVAQDPYREHLWELYAWGLHRRGQTSAALAAIERIRSSLRDGFGIDIAPSLARLEADLKDGAEVCAVPAGTITTMPARAALQRAPEPGPAETAPATQPSRPPVGDILGREAELRLLATVLGTPGLTTLIGPGGVGKTRLAIEVVRGAHGSQVPFWCDLAPAETPDAVEQLVAASLGVTPEPDHKARRALAAFIGAKQILLVLDTCEQAAGAVSDLAGFLLARCPRLVILATSREPLHLPAEKLFEVRPLRVPGQDEASEAAPGLVPATALLTLRYREAGGTDNGARLRRRMAHLARALEGMPLAIELAARWLAARSYPTCPDVNPGTVDLAVAGTLAAKPDGRPARQQTIWNTIEWSYRLVSSVEQRALQAVASFAGPFTLDEAIAVTSPAIPAGSLVSGLAGLIDKSLVQAEEVDGRSWYRVPGAVRAYVSERRQARPRTGAVRSQVVGRPVGSPALGR
jgi:predicted ATPase/DNA-binding SARP family transcriptional activator